MKFIILFKAIIIVKFISSKAQFFYNKYQINEMALTRKLMEA